MALADAISLANAQVFILVISNVIKGFRARVSRLLHRTRGMEFSSQSLLSQKQRNIHLRVSKI